MSTRMNRNFLILVLSRKVSEVLSPFSFKLYNKENSLDKKCSEITAD